MTRVLRGAGWLVVCVLLILIPRLVRNTYAVHLCVMSAQNVLLVLGLNLIMGFTGQTSMAQMGFAGIGAYGSALLALRLGLPFWLTMPMAVAIAAVLAALIAIPSLRLKGHYLIIVSVGFMVIMHQVFLNWVALTRGAMGLCGIPSPTPFWIFTFAPGSWDYYYLILAMAAACLVFTTRLVNSRVGRAMKAIREDEQAARSLGIDVELYKVGVFVIGSSMAAAAGAFMAHYMGMVAPESFTLKLSFNILTMLVIGGLGSIPGGIAGAVVFTILPEYLRVLAHYRELVNGLLVTLTVLFAPRGLAYGVSQAISRLARHAHQLSPHADDHLDGGAINNRG